jgi:DNA end-binding protein Ku
LPLTSSREIDVLSFVPLEQVDPIYFAKSYYLEPESKATKAYVLLRDALEESGRVAIVKVALRRREALATLRVREGVVTLETMLWPDEIRTPDFGFLTEKVEVRPQELSMAHSLIESLTGDFDPSQFSDEYRAAIDSVIQAKIEGRDVVPAPETADAGTPGKVVDLVAALQASIDAANRNRAGGSTAETAAAAPAQRRTAKKTASKVAEVADPAAKKSRKAAAPAKKTAARKSA